ncbi:MAG: nitroreductase [Clostridia bacterium]|nr:nitroreductase [Clostridia bacterium]
MDYRQAVRERHSVRDYLDRPIEEDIIANIKDKVNELNKISGLHIQFVTDEAKAFGGLIAHYGAFPGVKNYFVLIGKDDESLEEKCGYYGQKLVLLCQTLGLNTCWVALTYKKVKSAYTIDKGEKLCLVIAVGYGKTQGVAHKTKAPDKISDVKRDDPEWYKMGVEGALLAPTALNQQKFFIQRRGQEVNIKAQKGPYTKVDLGIVKCNFEVMAGEGNFSFIE